MLYIFLLRNEGKHFCLCLNLQEFVYANFDESIEYIQEFMIKHGPIDGLLGFSQVYLTLFFFVL